MLSTLFSRWQQQCSLSLSVVQQLVFLKHLVEGKGPVLGTGAAVYEQQQQQRPFNGL